MAGMVGWRLWESQEEAERRAEVEASWISMLVPARGLRPVESRVKCEPPSRAQRAALRRGGGARGEPTVPRGV